MRQFCLGIMMALACCAGPALGGESRIVIGDDGSVAGRFRFGQAAEQSVVFRFGLPRTASVRLWREGEVLHGLWVTNGLRYTEAVLVTAATNAAKSNGPGRAIPVLLVNIQGENTNSEYAEAVAELVLQIGSQRQVLELKEGLVWLLEGGARHLIGALEIPESGVRISRGEVLEFAGNMPPSEKGSMALKIPLEPLEDEETVEWLRDLDFGAELRQASKPRQEESTALGQGRLVFRGDF